MKKNIFIPILGLFLINIANCSNGLQSNKYGAISTSVKFPERKFSLKVIPDKTTLILVQIVGVGIDEKNPLTLTLSKDNSTRILDQVPQGEKTVKVIALDKDGTVLATGQTSINVIAQSLIKAEITLNNIKPNNNQQKNCNCTVQLSFSDLPLSKTLEKSIIDAGCTIKIPTSPSTIPSPTETPEASASPIESTKPISTPSPTATTSIYRGFGNSGGGGSNVTPTTPPTSSPVNVNVTYISPTPFPSTTVQ